MTNENSITLRKSLSQEITDKACHVEKSLRRIPFYGRLLSGEATAEEYAAFLVQVHKYVRFTVRSQRGLADAMAARGNDPAARMIRASASRLADEEAAHDDALLDDLAVLWGVTADEAWGRVERQETAPSVALYSRMVDLMLAHYPTGFVGVALAMETIATAHADEIRRSLVASSGILGIDGAVKFLEVHSAEIEDDHVNGARLRADALSSPTDRNAAFFFGNAALAFFEGIAHFLNEKHATTPARELLGAGA